MRESENVMCEYHSIFGENIWRLFYISIQFPFTTGEAELHYHQRKANRRISLQIVEHLRQYLKKLINFKKIYELLRIKGDQPKFRFYRRRRNIAKNQQQQLPLKKLILLDIIYLFTINILSNIVYINCTVK